MTSPRGRKTARRKQSSKSARPKHTSKRAWNSSVRKDTKEVDRICKDLGPQFTVLTRRFVKSMQPPVRIAPSEWADRYRRLPPEAAAEPGAYRSSRTPYIREPLDCVADKSVERIVCMFASQTAKTDGVLINALCYFIDADPSNILLVQPRDTDAKKFSKKRLSPTIRDTECLAEKVRETGRKMAESTMLEKAFPGGSLILGGSNSPANLAGDPIRILMMDEVDRFAASAGAEGDPISIAEVRTTTFPNRKIILTSSPTDEGVSQIEAAFEQSDKRYYFVPCPYCGERNTLKWKQVRWDKDEKGKGVPETARYECESCGEPWTEAERHEAVAKGAWKATAPFDGCAGFHLTALYAPWHNARLENLVDRFIKAKPYSLKLKTFVNTVLAETWKESATSLSEHELEKRKEKYPHYQGRIVVPKPVVVMTAGVDLQDDRLEMGVYGWGADEECWVQEHHIFRGDPAQPEVWNDLWEEIYKPRWMERGGMDFVRSVAVDTGGHHTQQAYEFCAPRIRVGTPDGRRMYVFAVKGQTGTGDIWPRLPSKNVDKVPLYMIRVDPAKELIYTRLGKILKPGPGYVHFPNLPQFDKQYFEQLTSEKVVLEHDKNGYPKRTWRLKVEGIRNEALDIFVYSVAALMGLKVMGFNLETEAAQLDKRPAYIPDEVSVDAIPTRPVKRRQRRVSRSSYLGR